MNAPEDKNGTHKPEILSRPRARRNAAKVLALTLQNRLRALYDAQTENDEDKIVMATANLAQVMYENIEFAIWALKSVAGMNPSPPEMLKPITQHAPPPANDPRFVKPPALELTDHPVGVPMNCTCPPMDKELIGASRHMTSCPLFQP
jgi:hypothetical protein